MIRVYIDENISPHIAKGLDTLEEPIRDHIQVLSLESVFGKGCLDEDWLPKAGNEKAIIITQDLNIHRTKRQRTLYQMHNLGVFFISPPSKSGYSYWEMVEQIIKR